MKIIYSDGGELECYSIEVCGDTMYADGIYIVPISEVNSIEED